MATTRPPGRGLTHLVAALAATALLAGCSAGSTSSTSTTPTSSSTPASSTSTSARPPVTTTSADPTVWRTVDASGRNLGVTVALLAGNLTPDGQLQIVHRTGPTAAQPLASVAKLYVMVAVLRAIAAGSLTWQQQLTVRGDDISAGSGTLAGRGAGARISVREAARLMFQVSDNTATSLLIRTIGSTGMDAAVRAAGHARPAAFQPFLTVREDLWLQYSPDLAASDARAKWAGATVAERRRLVQPAHAPTAGWPDFSRAPAWPHKIGYFATTTDIARAWVTLSTLARAKGAEPASGIMTVPSPGFTAPTGWKPVWFKSGALGGVTNGTWFSPVGTGGRVIVVLTSGGSVAATSISNLGSKAAAALAKTPPQP